MALHRTEEAAAQLNVKPTTLEAWRTRGEGPEYVKLGKAVRYSSEALENFIKSRTRTSTSKEG
jgi:predicted DNA-binding transcriptional regulator AlpA